MLYPGLVSITFRDLRPLEIIALVQQGGGKSIEWGGDVHVPPGDEATARIVRQMTHDAGLMVSAYGSYYRLHPDDEEENPFAAVLTSAVELGAPVIRVWAGNQSPDALTAEERREIALRAREIADEAATENIQVAFEYHSRTLTETTGATLELMQTVNHPNVGLFWQPRHGWLLDENIVGLKRAADWITNIHCFHWWPTSKDRLPLVAGEANWQNYLNRIAMLNGAHHISIEFVRDGQPEQYLRDARVLNQWLDARHNSATDPA